MVQFLMRKTMEKHRSVMQKLWWFAYRGQFGKVGNNVRIEYPGSFTYKSIFIGNHVYIGQNARLWAVESKIYIADKVVIGPQLVIMGGDHNIHEVGKYIIDIYNKEAENDKDVFIESDTWIGSNVTILKGVTIARGAVIGAGSVVTKSIPPYGIAAGNPAKVIKYRFSPEEIIKHESILYPKS